MKNVFVIGLSGGIGSGKSTVASALRRLGAEVLDADAMVHELLCTRKVVGRIARRFGRGVLDSKGRIDRRRLAAAAFAKRKTIRDLERLLHPEVIARTKSRVAALARSKGRHVVVIDAPLLYEAKMHRMCDEVVFVDAPRRERARRLKTQRGWAASELAGREKHQKSVDFKRRNADTVIHNVSPARTNAQVREYWRRVTTLLGG